MNQENFYKYVKLMTGEEIICRFDQDVLNFKYNDLVTIYDPVTIKILRYPKGNDMVEGYMLYPWVKFVEENVFMIPMRMMVSIASIDEKMRKTYISFIKQEKEIDESEKISLQDFLKNVENKEVDNAEEITEKIHNRRTLH